MVWPPPTSSDNLSNDRALPVSLVTRVTRDGGQAGVTELTVNY